MSEITSMAALKKWNEDVMSEFRANGGKVAQFANAPMIIMHAIGAKSGKVYETPLVYKPDGDRMLVIASKAGAPTHPAWYHNLLANPRIDVEVGTDRFTVEVTELKGEERDSKFAEIKALMPNFAVYETKAAPRLIPLLALTRVE